MRATPFKDQVVIISGASSGIGRSLAMQLAGQGARVVLAARRAGRLEQVAADCRKLGAEAVVVPTDVAVESQCSTLVEKTLATFGRLDMLICNAGMNVLARLGDLRDLDLFRKVMDINFYGVVHIAFHALPHLLRSQGRLVVISSLGGKQALPYNSAYVASKHALQGFCDSLRMELKPGGVSVSVILPWWVISEFHEAQLDKDGIQKGPGGRAIYTKGMMTSDQCARRILQAAAARKREVVMGPGHLANWLKLMAPSLMDRMVIRFLMRTAQRVKAKQ